MDGSTLLLNAAYLVLVASTLTRTLVWLRGLLVLGAIGFVSYGIVTSNPTIATWNAITGSLHAVQLVRYVRARRSVALTLDDRHWHQALFPDLNAFDFYLLWSAGEEVHHTDEQLTVAGKHHGRVSLILEGSVEVVGDGIAPVHLGPGTLIGEMSYVSGEAATRDARAIGEVRLREWDQERLDTLQHVDPTAGRAMNRFIQRDLASKLG
jgi:hypothetical protein